MRIFLISMLIAFFMNAAGQSKPVMSNKLSLSGNITQPLTYTIAALDTFAKTDIGNVTFSDSKGMKYTGKTLQGIPLKELFAKTNFRAENHKALNKFYLVCKAPDGYEVVFSYNEIFSHMACTNYYLVTSYDGKGLADMPDKILLISCDANHQGHKFIKGLETITVHEAQ